MRIRSLTAVIVVFATLSIGAAAHATKREPPPCGNFGALRVSFMTGEGLLVHRVEPQYPALGRNMRIQGEVVLYVLVDKRGTPKSICALSGHPMLMPAAIDAVRQWRWKPYVLNKKAREIEFPVSVSFKLKP